MLNGMLIGAITTLVVFWPLIYEGFHHEVREDPPFVAMHIPAVPCVASELDK